jgi:hypothetical protein
MQMLLLLLMSEVTHAQLPLPSSVHFSWDTVQPFFHADNVTGPFSDQAIASIARFPLVTLEKWHGACAGARLNRSNRGDHCPSTSRDHYPCCEEQRIISDLGRVKALNPNATTVIYFNMVLDFPQYRLHREMVAHPHWGLALPNGSRCLMDGDSGPAVPRPAAHGSYGAMQIFDFGNPEVVALFVSACVEPVKAGLADGCFFDRAISCLPTQSCALVCTPASPKLLPC